MADNYTLDGNNYTQEEVLEAAEAKSLTIENYISEYYPDDVAGKTNDSVNADPIAESNDMDSGSDDGSLESVKIVEGKGMFAGETELPSVLGGLVKKVKNTKDFVKGIFNTQDSVKENNEKVTSRAAEKYFSLDAMPDRQTREVFTSEYTTETVFVEPKEKDLRAYFEDDKYEEYIKWDGGNGELPASIKFKSDVEVEQKNRKRELTEEYIGINVPEDKQIEAYLALPSVVGDEKEVVIDGKTYKNPKELYNTLKKRDAELGTTKAIDFEADYLAASNEGFNNDYEKYEADLAKYEKDNEPILKQQASLVDKFKKLGKVDENSSEQEISDYNALVVENNNLQDQLNQGDSNALIETQKSLKTRFDDLISKADTFENTSMAATALGLDYSLGARVSLQLEKTFLAGGAVLGAGTMKLLGKLGEVKYPTQQDIKIYEALDRNYKNAINYYDEVGKEIETTLPTTIKVKDINSGNVFEAAKQMLGNNAPSILVALGTSGTGAFLTRGLTQEAAKQTRRKMANLGMGIFFEMEAGGKIGDIEVGEKYAQGNIDALNAMLERDKKEGIVKTPDEILGIKQQISDNENALSFTGMQKAFSTVMYGGIASYAERLGTLSYMNGLTKTSKVYGAGLFKKTIRGAKGAIYNTGVELIEETVTTLGHNLTDITVLNENKSMIEGLDADFLVNTVFTSLAIQGPSMGMNSYNALKGEVTTRQEREESRVRTQEVLQIQNELNNTSPLNFEKRRELTKRKLELLQEAEITDVQVVQKISRMTPKEVTDLFEANRLKREALKNLQELGGDIDSQSEFNKKQKERLIEEYNKHEGKRELLLGKPDARNKKDIEAALKKAGFERGVDHNIGDEAEMAFQLGKYQLNQDILKNIVGQENVQIFKGENSKQQLEEYLKQKVKDNVISQEEADKALAGNKNAMFIGSEYVLMEDVALEGIVNGGAAALFAASSPLHELLHRDLIEAGIVVDGKIVKSAEDVVASIENHLNSLSENNLIDKKNAKIIKNRIEQYRSKEGVDLEELITLVGDLKDQGVISRETMSLNYDLKRFIKLTAGKLLGDKNAFLGFNTIEDIFRYIDSFQNRAKDQTLVIPPDEKEETVKIKESKAVDKRSPEDLIKIIKRKSSSPPQIKAAEDALVPQYEALAVEALKYTEAKGDILRKNVVSAANVYYKAIVKNYDPKKGKFSTHVYNNIAPKNDTIFEEAKTLEKRDESVSLNAPEAMQVEGDAGKTTNTEKTFVQKINILQDFAIANRVADKIKALVKVGKGDNFKSIISKYAGKVGALIFEIPANKIMEGGANLAAVTKYTEGMPAPAEAQNIQRFFNAPNNADKFLKTLPLYNVTDKTADINKIGENLDVSRDTYGYAIGLKGLPLDYFYENYTDPTGEITSPKGRSKGLTSQTQVKRLKPQFRKPTPETVDQFKKDLGITPKNEANVYSRDIGQLLKGVAKVHSINAAISGAQRVQEAKLKTAPVTEQKAIKQQTADITTAQSKIAFSEAVKNVQVSVDAMYTLQGGAIKLTFEGDLDRVDKILKKFTGEGTYKFKDEEQIRDYFKDFEGIVIENLPRNMFMGALNSFLKPSKRILPNKGEGEITLEDGRTVTINDFFDEMRAELVKRSKEDYKGKDKVVFGAKFKGKGANYVYGRTYGKIYGKTEKEIKTSFYDGTRKEYNAVFVSMHEQFMARVNSSIRKDNNNARVWGNYFSLVGQDTEHPWRMGAEWVLFSKNPIGAEGKLYEWEHAMMATRSYLYLLETSLEQINGEYLDFNRAYKLVMENYKLIALDNYEDKIKLGGSGRQKTMGKDWQFLINTWLDRYFHPEVAAIKGKNGFGIDPKRLRGEGGRTAADIYNINVEGKMPGMKTGVNKTKKLNKAVVQGRKTIKESKGITVLDFDDTLATSKSLIRFTKPDGTKGTLNAEQYASTYQELTDLGYKWDFSEFNEVVDGKVAPLFNKAMKLQGKFGPENMFVLTARPMEAAPAIFAFLKANGLNIPLRNITGLANSTAEAKALWMADKVGEGYNDFYFADDALQNVQAVDNILEQFDVKRKVQQAKLKFSESMNIDFNNILENVTGIESEKRFSDIKARKRGDDKGKFRLFIPPSHEDFVGLLYNFMGKGKEGNAHRDFFEQALVRPLNRAYKEIDTAKQAIANDYKALNKQFPNIKDKLIKNTPDGDFTFQDAIRVYLWNKHGYKIPGLTTTDQQSLVELVNQDAELKAYAETLNVISKQDMYVDPGQAWETGNIRIDLIDATGRVGRKQYFTEFNENAEVLFSEENLNKIEAAYGKDFRESLEDMLHRIKTGVNRPKGSNAKPNIFMNWLNASVSGVMFFNTRSALLQQMSNVNFLNFADNNIFKAGLAFANQKQYWKDFAMIFNSDMLKQRRGGLGTDINGAELAEAIKKARPDNVFDQVSIIVGKALKLGFLPTQIGDNIAIATGGAAFYRNRVNKYVKDGMSQKEAEAAAFTDFQNITQSTQQSARPDMTSKQQASWIGKLVLNFLNTPSQYNRIIKKAGSDIINRRITPPNTTQVQSDMSNSSRILYYGAAQNLIFYSLQTALFAVMFGTDDEDDDKRAEQFLKKKERVINGTIDTLLRGSGIYGVAVSTLKNMIIKFLEQRDKGFNKDESAVIMELANFSPVVGIKLRKIVNAEKTLNYNKKVIDEMETFDIDNPQWSAVTNYVEAITTAPTNRIYQKSINLRNAADNQYTAFQRALFLSGYTTWSLNLGDTEKMKDIKQKLKGKKNNKGFGNKTFNKKTFKRKTFN